MTLYSKNGSIPKPETDGTEGWIEVPDMPIASEGKEVVWWYPPGWVIRDPKPEQSLQLFNTYDLEGNIINTEEKMADWSWSQSEERWVAYVLPVVDIINFNNVITLSLAEPSVSLTTGTASDTILGA